MQDCIIELESIIARYPSLIGELDPSAASEKTSPIKWSKKEILGHLVDSAENNIRRFIVAQYEQTPLIVYRQEEWVRASNYNAWPLTDILQLWILLNKQLLKIIENMPSEFENKEVQTGNLHSLAWLASDYTRHLLHHLHQMLELEDVAYP